MFAATGCQADAPVDPGLSTAPATPTLEPDQTATPVGGGSLRFGLGGDPDSIDPRFAGDEEGLLVVDTLFDSLTALDDNLRPIPAVATSWEISQDGLTWTFTLDGEERFHDGSRVVAQDFVRAFNRIVDGTAVPRSFLAHQLVDVAGWQQAQDTGVPLAGLAVLDDGRLEVTLRRPNSELADLLAHPTLAPVPPQADLDPRAFGEQPVGNGPFQMAEAWAHRQFIRVVRADPDVILDEVLFRIYADDPGQAQQYADYVNGQLQVAEVPPSQRATAIATYGLAGDGTLGSGVLDGPRAATYEFGFRTTLPPFDNPIVRRAVSLLIDREAIAQDVMLGSRQPSRSLLPRGLAGTRPGSCDECRFDPAAAQALLDAAGIVLDPEQIGTITLLHNEGTTHAAIAERVASAIRTHLGLDVEVVSRDLAGFAAAVRAGEAHIFRHGWTAEHGTSGAMLVPLFHSRAIAEDNLFAFSDPALDELLDAALTTQDRGERLALFTEAENLLLQEMPVIPLLAYDLGRVVAADVRGFRMDALGRVDLSVVALAAP